ncbi:MAG: DUF3800 domain-containing protein [Treponema sp.]|nr:DUF3800 domain-containing protein [Treponema sp.]
MPKKTLSIFIDESGDFGPYDSHSPNYYVAMVFHDQSIDISQEIENLDNYIAQKGFPFHAIHAGPLIRREQIYADDERERRQELFTILYQFARRMPIRYICPRINKADCEDTELAYTARLSKVISDELKRIYDYLNTYDLRIVYYDYGQAGLTKIITSVFSSLFSNVEFRRVQPADYKLFQVADLICTMELTNDKAERNALSKSELEFFHSAHDFKKNLYKQLKKKML